MEALLEVRRKDASRLYDDCMREFGNGAELGVDNITSRDRNAIKTLKKTKAVGKGIGNFKEKVRRSKLQVSDKAFLPLYQGGNWRRNEKAKVKAMKRKSWYQDKERDSTNKKRMGKRKKAGIYEWQKLDVLQLGKLPKTSSFSKY
jgi:hypothetical protein